MLLMKKLGLVSVLALLTGCANMPIGNQGGVAILDQGTRAHLSTELTMADYTAFA